MLISGSIVFLFILGLFLQAVTSSPRTDVPLESDTDGEVPTAPAETDTPSVAA
jgi:hypothetical protein